MVVVAGTVLAIAGAATAIAAAAPGGTHARTVLFAYVANSGDGTVTPINLGTGHPGAPIKAGSSPDAIAITPDGRTAYVLDTTSDAITPINLAADRPGPRITLEGGAPTAIAITPDGKTAYVVSLGIPSGTLPPNGFGIVTPVTLATGRPGRPIDVAASPQAIAITPNGTTAYVIEGDGGGILPVNVATGRPGTPIKVGIGEPSAIAITPDGRMAYVVTLHTPPGTIYPDGPGTVIPVNLTTGRLGAPIKVGKYPLAIAITP